MCLLMRSSSVLCGSCFWHTGHRTCPDFRGDSAGGGGGGDGGGAATTASEEPAGSAVGSKASWSCFRFLVGPKEPLPRSCCSDPMPLIASVISVPKLSWCCPTAPLAH